MADPFSIAANAAGVIDLSIRVVKFIYKTKKGTDTVDEDLRLLVDDIEKLRNVSELIRKAFGPEMKEGEKVPRVDDDAATGIWRAAASALQDCRAALNTLDGVLSQIRGEEGSSTFDRLRRHFRMLAKDEEFEQIRTRLEKGHQVLQMSLTALQIIVTRQSQMGNSKSLADMSAQMASWEARLGQLIQSLEGTMGDTKNTPHEREGIATAKSVKKLAWLNVYFMVPQTVSNMFVGREPDLAQLRQAVEQFKQDRGTKRVVIYGLGGSGKTQFCCKFAQDNRSSFWGVFTIDATDAISIQTSYARIAHRVGIEPKETNVKHWLSEQTKPWLLIVDNADDHLRTHHPEDLIPESDSGIVLFTTRNHLLRTLGHFAIKFEGLEAERSSTLLLTAAGRPEPFAPKILSKATDVCRKFGFLPLAILHTGRAILQGRCTLDDCLTYVETSLARVQKIINDGKANQIFSPTSEVTNFASDTTRSTNESVYATYELVIPAASEEAKQLLHLLSFMQSQHFEFQILLKAIVNPQRQISADRNPAKGGSPSGIWRRSRKGIWHDVLRKVYGFLVDLGDRPALPIVLRSLKNAELKDAEFRLREVLSELRELAVLDYVEGDDAYYVHSSVNWWIRASMGYGEKAVWCQAACNVLASSILLPPVGVQDGDAQLRRQAFPHIECVRKQEERLRLELKKKQAKRGRTWRDAEPALGRARILRDAKFSLVYAECGKWRDSQELMLGIDKFLVEAVGLDDPIAIRVRLFLSDTYWWLGDANETVRLQEELLEACRSSLGEDHVDTLTVTDRLGSSYWQQGKIHKARDFAQRAVNGFEKAYPAGHLDTFRAMTNLGRCVGKLAAFDGAVKLHSEALNGLVQAQHGSESEFGEQILDVKSNLAMARHDRFCYGHPQDDDLDEAAELQSAVLRSHEKKLGKEHPKSLWATCNLARIKASMGDLEEAEQLIKKCVPVAERTIGADHIGTLMGMAYLGQILTRAAKLEEAEEVLRTVVDKYRARDEGHMHPDHLVAAALLLDCYRRREKYEVAERIEGEVLKGIRHLFGEGSPWEHYFVGRYTVDKTRTSVSEDS